MTAKKYCTEAMRVNKKADVIRVTALPETRQQQHLFANRVLILGTRIILGFAKHF